MDFYFFERIVMIIGGDVINEVIIIFCLGYCIVLMSCIGKDVVG